MGRGSSLSRRHRQYLTGGVFTLAGANLICRILGFAFKVPLANLIGAEGMGYYGIAWQVYGAVTSLAMSGLPGAFAWIVASAPGETRRTALRGCLPMFVLTGFVSAVSLAALSGVLCGAAGSPQAYPAVLILAPNAFCAALEAAYRGYFQGCGNLRPAAKAQTAEAVVKLLIGTAAAWALHRRGYPAPVVAAGAMIGVTVGTVVSMTLFAVSAHRAPGIAERAAFPELRRRLFRAALPLSVGSVLLNLMSAADTAVILRCLRFTGMSDGSAAGAYGAYTGMAMTVCGLPSAVTSAVCAGVVPTVAACFEPDQRRVRLSASAVARLDRAFRLCGAITLFAGAMFAFLPKELLSAVFSRGGDVAVAAPLLRLAAPVAALSAVCAVSGAMLHGAGEMTFPVISSIVSGLVQLGVTLCCIRFAGMGVSGAPVGAVAGLAIHAVLNLAACARKCGYRPPILRSFILPLLCAVASGAAAGFVYRALCPIFSGRVSACAAVMSAAALCAVLLVVCGVIRRSDLTEKRK